MKTKLLLLLLLANFSIYAQQYTSIPDVNFETKLISLGIDSGATDGRVLTSKIASLTFLNVEKSAITDLTGIEAFTALKELRCSSNRLTQLNLSKSIVLTSLECSNNLLTTLDISNNPLLLTLDCSQNKLTALDFSNNTALKTIYCYSNQLTTLNVSKQLMLEQFFCYNNKIETLDVSSNVNLSSLICHTNLLQNLDLSKNTKLSYVQAHDNRLISFNIQNGTNYLFNDSFSTLTFASPNLKCVQVDNVEEANVRWASVKGNAQYSTYCSPYTIIPDANFEKKLILLGIDKDGENGKVLTADITSVTSLNVSNSSITDLTGIEDFHSLTNLSCDGNQLSTLDITKNIYLTALSCNQNKITTLNLEHNPALKTLSCSSNQLTKIDLFYNRSLQIVDISQNKFEKLVTSYNEVLTSLSLNENLITSLDLSVNRVLTSLSVDANRLTTLNLTNNTLLTNAVSFKSNPDLYCIQVSDVAYANTNWSNKKDNTTSFSSSPCLLSDYFTLIPDINFENRLISQGIDSGVADGKIRTTKVASLTSLNVSQSSISNLTGIEAFVSLKTLNCANNKLTQLDVSKSTALTSLECNNNQLSKLNITNNPLLLVLECSNNNILGLNFSNNTALTSIRCYNNFINNINVSAQLALESLDINSNMLQTLDLSSNVNLQSLICNNNSIKSLDLSKNTKLTTMLAHINELTSLNIKNGANNLFNNPGSAIRFDYNPYLVCIQVDNIEEANAHWSKQKNPESSFNTDCTPYTLIPDLNFENKLISLGIDSGAPDGKVRTSNIRTVKLLALAKSNISDLTGIQDFVSLTDLYCGQNSLTTLNVSKNTALTTLDCNNNKITSLDVSNNIALLTLSCYANQLTALDVKVNTALTKLDSGSNQYTALDVSSNTALTFLGCNTSQLTSLDVSKNTALNLLDCRENKLTHLDVSKIATLTELYCQSNQLTNVDVSKNKALEFLNSSKNQLTTLDVSVNTALVGLYANSNQLTSLNLKNANNVKFAYLNLIDNPNLSCIQVDDSNYFNTNWADKKDKNASYNVNCTSYTQIPDSNFEKKLIDLGIDTGVSDGKVLTKNVSAVTELNLYGASISDLTGIQDFASLTTLNCMSNKLTSIDVSQNLALTYLDVSYNTLTTLDVSKNLSLENLSISYNNFTSIDVSKNLNLQYFTCISNQLTNIDTSKNLKLMALWCSSNQITILDLTKNTSLNSIICTDNKLTNLDLRNGNNKSITSTSIGLAKNPSLSCIQVDDALYSNNNWANFKDASAGFSTVDCSLVTAIPDQYFEDKLIILGIDKDGKNGTVLNSSISSTTSLDVSSSLIKNLTGIEGFSKLTSLNCSDNLLSALDLSRNSSLILIDCSNNELMSLNLKNGNNANLDLKSNFTKNPKLSCIQVDNSDYSTNNWLSIKDATANYNVDCTNYTLIPDSSFEQKLIDLGIDTDGLNGKITTADISTITHLDLSNSNITDLSGIKDFTSLIYLNCDYNNLTSIDISNNKALTVLSLNGNKLTSLDVTANTELFNLAFSTNQISTIDLSKNTKVHNLVADQNLLTEIDLSKNPEIEILYCGRNNLTTINVSNLPNLLQLNCTNTNIAALDVTSNPKLEMLYFNDAKLTTLDLSHNPLLKRLNVSRNLLTTLDLSHNPLLELAFLEFNPLESLNIQNGNNENFILPAETGKKSSSDVYTSFLGNTKLSCIKVDDVAFSNAKWSKIKEPTTTYSTTCKNLGIEDTIFDKAVVYPNPTKGEVTISNITLDKATVYNTLGQLVRSFTLNSDSTNTINLSGLPKGVYYVYLINQDAASVKKVIVE